MSKYHILNILILSILGFGSVHAQSYDMYLSGNLGIGMLQDAKTFLTDMPDDTVDLGFSNDITLSSAIGLMNGNYRSELEFSYQKNDFKDIRALGTTIDLTNTGLSGDVKTLSGMVNAYIDFNMNNNFKPYISAGIGFANIDADINVEGVDEVTFGENDTVLSYQFSLGLGYPISENATVDLRYRLLSTQDPEFDGVTSNFLTHNFLAGFRLSF